MFGLFKKWVSDTAEMRDIQQELTEALARRGINFMHLHPDLHKFLLLYAREVGADNAIDKLNEIMATVVSDFPQLNQQQQLDQIVRSVKSFSISARG